ncbi:ATP-binding protein [Roseibium sp. HPY-6]|uniref:ATP-binding protein n=1 Tax=Roseibium sp. HPY-6 TaxID=3229852 RepID=UPI00338EFE4A
MDNQTQSFLELSAMKDLVQIAADKRAAWLWSADGAKILWSNAAGAAFFSAQSVSELAALTALERSPARPHIARIAQSGLTDRFSIDRLRFYRGLRVMLLTCQCKRVELPDGGTAALIVCSDKGLALTKEPIPAFAHLLRSDGTTVFLISDETVEETYGALTGNPEALELPQGQRVLFGPLDLNGSYHDSGILQIPAGPRIIVVQDAPLNDQEAPEEPDTETDEAAAPVMSPVVATSEDVADADAVEEVASEDAQPEDAETLGADAAADEPGQEHEPEISAGDDPIIDEAPEPIAADAENDLQESAPESELDTQDDAETSSLVADPSEPDGALDAEDAGAPDSDTANIAAETEPSEDEPSLSDNGPDDADVVDGFVFQPRRRPVRFAWKMDIEQRFTFLSDEFAEVLGPDATNIVGATWADVSEEFGLDPRGNIARALDRRDTWSGKTVAWPVTGAALRVPVDMAALPAFDRNRKFEGYRGFGVCRTSDAVQDPDGFIPAPIIAPVPIEGDETPPAKTDAAAGTEDIADQHEDVADRDEHGLETPDPNDAPIDEDASDLHIEAEPEGQPEAPEESEEHTEIDADDRLSENGTNSVTEGVKENAELSDTVTSDAAEDGTDEAAVEVQPETHDAEPSGETSEEVAADSTAAEQDLSDLKPATPNSLGGRTFLGASAAALVGSLSMFKGKKDAKPAEPVNDREPVPETAELAESEAADSTNDLSEDLKNAAAALDAAPEDDVLEPEAETTSENLESAPDGSEEIDDPVTSDEDDIASEGNESETGSSEETPESSEGTPAEEVADGAEDTADAVEDIAAGAPDQVDETDEDKHESGAADHADADAVESGAVEETASESIDKEAEEPVGIAGPAALKPAEIESAVKSLAKSYKQSETKSPDLFDDAGEEAAVEEHAHEESAHEEATEASLDEELETGTTIDEESDDALFEAANEEADDEEGDDEESGDAGQPSADLLPEIDEDPAVDEEREFFEETAAFEQEERAAEAEKSSDDTSEPEQRTGEVIPLATARPRVVPVDTSGLSRPERQAFRKIAEALGARLEGDLEDFEAPDPEEEEPIDELPPEVPEAGPIDPTLLDRLPIGISIVHDREVLYANKALLKMLGYTSVASLCEAGGLEALFIDDTEELTDAVGVDGEVDEAMKVRLADGGVMNVDAHMHSVPWNGSHGLMISITERPSRQTPADSVPASPNFFAEVRSELDNARDQIAEMDTILETATDGVLVLDQHGTIVKVNGSAEALFSANRADMIGAPFTEFLAPESHRAATDYLDGLSKNGVASILNDGREVLGQVPAGGLIPLFMTMGRITSRNDDAKYCAVLRDITQWKTAEEELTQAKRQAENASSQKSDFLAKISHEIRTPLNAIIGFSEVMMEERFGAIGNDRYKDYLKDIRTSGSHIMSLINDLLDLSKIEAGKLDLQFTAVSTNEVINECVALMQPQANRERVIIRASLPESVPDVVADARSLRQIVLNLLSNGIKYNKSGGQVILSTALESNGEVALRVRDTGTGMTAKQLTAALEPFRQLHTASRGGGTGLGLPLTKALVEANRASFHIDSTPDQGTLVEIVFPTQRVLSE